MLVSTPQPQNRYTARKTTQYKATKPMLYMPKSIKPKKGKEKTKIF